MPPVNLYNYHRGELSKTQKEWFVKLVPFARKIQEWTLLKSSFLNIECPRGVLASITLADIIWESNWGDHPISKTEFSNRYSNNLSLIPSNEAWKGRTNNYEGVSYKAFKDWQEYSINLSDEYCFSRNFDIVLMCRKRELQIQGLSYTKPNYKAWADGVSHLIDHYNLTEFD